MKKFLIIFLVFSCCLPSKSQVQPLHKPGILGSVLYLPKEKPILYQASFKVLKYQFSGLMVFKQTSKENTIKVSLLSEAGLSVADFNVVNNKAILVKCIPVLRKKAAINYLCRLIEMLVYKPDCTESSIHGANIYCKCKKGRYIYSPEDEAQQVIYKRGLRKKAIGKGKYPGYTEKISFLKGKKSIIELKMIKNGLK